MAVWVIVNVEHWHHDNAMPRAVLPPPMGQALLPDIPNWAWHEYGMRVGFWRFVEVFKRHHITPTLAINGSVCTAYPRIAQAAHELNWEFMGHGFLHGPITSVPYTVELNDVVLSAVQLHTSDELLKRGKLQFDQLYAESTDSARVMAISIHPYLTGVPHRIGALDALCQYITEHEDVAFYTGEQIHDWYQTQPKPDF